MNNKRIVGIITIVVVLIVVWYALPILITLAANVFVLALLVLLGAFVIYAISRFFKKEA